MAFFNFKEIGNLKKNLENLCSENEVLNQNFQKVSQENERLKSEKLMIEKCVSDLSLQRDDIQKAVEIAEQQVSENNNKISELNSEKLRLTALKESLSEILIGLENSDIRFNGKKFNAFDYLINSASEEYRESVEIAVEKSCKFDNHKEAVEYVIDEYFSPSAIFVFKDCEGGCMLMEYIGKKTEKVVIPETYRGKKVVSLNKFDMFNGIFSYNTVIREVEILADIQEIPSYTFSYCENLKRITFNESLREIGDYAFAKCRKLEKITLNPELRTIGKYVFTDCDSISSVDFNSKLEVIDEFAFSCCDEIKTLNLPKSLKRLYTLGCPNIREIYFNARDTFLGENPFHYINQYTDFISDESFSSGFYERKESEFVIPKNLTIYCKRGSDACNYALKNGINIRYIDK